MEPFDGRRQLARRQAVDLTPFNLGDNVDAGQHQVADQPLFDANNSDDIIFGGWGGDFIHGGSGDDAISGAEALGTSRAQHFDSNGNPVGLELIDFLHPYNPGDVLHFGADTNAWHSNNHNMGRLGEFLLYDEYDPRRVILFNTDGSVWKSVTPPWSRPFFLNNDATSGNFVTACTAVDNQGNCTTTVANMPSDGDDVVFGDLGNDWSVGGTGKDTIWAGWGNDLSNADDTLTTNIGQNDVPDGPNSSYEDRVYGGAGLDILIGNTGGDRLIDWVGEFNSYLVPFAPFGIATVSRQVPPQLPEFLYALARSQGVDMTRATDVGSDPVRNGEPFGELGLITQHDHGQWQTQTGGPTDPQAGNIPGGKRDILRSADFNDGSAQSFAPDSGSWTVSGGKLQVAAASLGQDAVAVWNADAYLPIYYEISASISMQKPVGGWKANSFVIFDYWSPTDFKFAGIDVAINKMVIGHRDANGWWYDAQGSVTGSLNPATFYNILVAVNGTYVTVSIGRQAISYMFAPRILRNGDQVALNKGFLGFGSNNSRGLLDNVALNVLAPQITLDTTEFFDDGTAGNFPATAASSTGAWNISTGRYVGTATAGTTAHSAASFGSTGIDTLSYVEVEATFTANGVTGIIFDYYATSDYKFVVLDVPGQRVLIGHVSPRNGWVVDQAIAKALAAGAEYTLNLVLKATVATVTLNGQVLASRSFNAAVTDGRTGVLGQGAAASFDRFRFRTDDDQFTGPATPQREVRISDATVVEGNSGSKTVTLSLTLSQAQSTPLTVSWTTLNGTAMAGTDFLGVTSGTVTFAPSSTTATITLTVYGDTLYEPNEQFMVQLLAGPDFNLADGFGTVTMTNDDAAPVAPKAGMTSTSTATAPTTTTSTTTTAAASSLLVAATSDTSSPTTLAAAKSAPLTVNYPPGGGVSFTVQGANNWDFYSVRVTCGGYSTILTVVIGADGTGTTEVFYPPSGTCTATLEIPQQTNRPRVLATITFTVS